VLIAVPNCQGRVSPVFDVAARLVLVRLKGEAEVERKEVVLFERHPDGIVRSLRELGIKVMICGAISRGLQVALKHAGVRVVPQICGELEAVIAAFRTGTLGQPEFTMPGCCGRRWESGRRQGARVAPVVGEMRERTDYKLMKIAIPVENGRLHSHFGGSRQFAIIEVDPNTKTTVRAETLPAPEHKPGAFPRWLGELGVNVVIVGGIGQRALSLFAQSGINVVAGQPGETVEKLVGDYLDGELNAQPEGCHEHGHHHHHPQAHGSEHGHGQPGGGCQQ
jgi:predicted Fe-Mo cluster-binding NifX family protein